MGAAELLLGPGVRWPASAAAAGGEDRCLCRGRGRAGAEGAARSTGRAENTRRHSNDPGEHAGLLVRPGKGQEASQSRTASLKTGGGGQDPPPHPNRKDFKGKGLRSTCY